MGSLQATEIIKEILDIGETMAGYINLYDVLNNNFRKIKINIDQIVIFVKNIEKMKNNKNSKILIILFTSDFYKYYYGLNLASTYKAVIKKLVYFIQGMLLIFY